MKCPHCTVSIHEAWVPTGLGDDADGTWAVLRMPCPACNRLIFDLSLAEGGTITQRYTIRPRSAARSPLSQDVPSDYAEDYREASSVLADSPKASGALSRRCLQRLLREKAGVKPGNLSDEIKEAMKSLPTHLASAIDAIRNVGNFAAHPMKDTSTGEIVDVELGEAEWCLDVIESLFDHFFVQPALLQQKRAALDQKLQGAGKPPMK